MYGGFLIRGELSCNFDSLLFFVFVFDQSSFFDLDNTLKKAPPVFLFPPILSFFVVESKEKGREKKKREKNI